MWEKHRAPCGQEVGSHTLTSGSHALLSAGPQEETWEENLRSLSLQVKEKNKTKNQNKPKSHVPGELPAARSPGLGVEAGETPNRGAGGAAVLFRTLRAHVPCPLLRADKEVQGRGGPGRGRPWMLAPWVAGFVFLSGQISRNPPWASLVTVLPIYLKVKQTAAWKTKQKNPNNNKKPCLQARAHSHAHTVYINVYIAQVYMLCTVYSSINIKHRYS